MKKTLFSIFYLGLFLLILVSCGSNTNSTKDPEQVVSNFLQTLQEQNYSSAKNYYAENLDNMAHFRNQIEVINPTVANKLFEKMADFSYTIHQVTIDPNDPNQATVTATIDAYDLGKSFEETVLEYIKNDIKMTFDGSKSDDIIQRAEEILVKDIESSQKTFSTDVTISLTKDQDVWKIDKIGDNPSLLNALSGNIIATIDNLSNHLNATY